MPDMSPIADAVDDGSLAGHAGRDPGGVRPVILNGLRVEALLVGLVVEDFGNNDFWRDVLAVLILVVRIAICCIALGEARGIAEASRIEERMRLIDTGVDVANLNACAGNRSATGRIPGIHRIDDLVALAQVGMIKRVVLGALHHRCGCDCRQWRPVELDRHCVE